jgi:hypothetical protein
LDAGASQLLAVKFDRRRDRYHLFVGCSVPDTLGSQMLALAGAASFPANTALLTQKVDRPQADSAIKNSGSSPTTELQQINQQLLAEITQRERVEELLLDAVDKLQESEERFRVFQELSLDGFNVFRSIRDESTILWILNGNTSIPQRQKCNTVPLKN